MGDIKHYALNDQESGRNAVNITIDKRAARESDLLAFEIGLQESDIAAVMCSYNRLDGVYACENKYLLTDLLKRDWNFKGFVLSDWGGDAQHRKGFGGGTGSRRAWLDFLRRRFQEGGGVGQSADDGTG